MIAFDYQELATPALRSSYPNSQVKIHPTTTYDYETIISNPRVDFLEPPHENDIYDAQKVLRFSFPPLIKRWIKDFGTLQIYLDLENDPKLLLLGLSPESSIDDDIILFNDFNNPSVPAGYLVFAHEFDGESDIVYALRSDFTVASLKNQFVFPYFRHKDCYPEAKWKAAFKSVEQFWESKVERYLTG